MRVEYVTGIRLELLKAIKAANTEGRFIEHIAITQKEYTELLKDMGAPANAKLTNFMGTPLEVEGGLKVIVPFGH